MKLRQTRLGPSLSLPTAGMVAREVRVGLAEEAGLAVLAERAAMAHRARIAFLGLGMVDMAE
jgi:hypothetical protein